MLDIRELREAADQGQEPCEEALIICRGIAFTTEAGAMLLHDPADAKRRDQLERCLHRVVMGEEDQSEGGAESDDGQPPAT